MKLRDIAIKINNLLARNVFLSKILFKYIPSNNVLFGKRYKQIKESSLSPNYDTKKLIDLVNHAKDTVPYYMNQEWPVIKDINDFEKHINFINRDHILNNLSEFKSENFEVSEYEKMTTGGTSGRPAVFFVPKNRYIKEYAFFHGIWQKLGYRNQLKGVTRNERLPEKQDYKIKIITKEIVFDGFRNDPEYYKKIYSHIKKFNIEYIQGYPSSVYNFLLYIHNNKLSTSFLKGIFLSSEVFLDHQRNLIVNTLKIPVISVYGHSEKLILAVDFNGDDKYEVIDNYGYLELIDEEGNVIKELDKVGEIVGTTIDNYGMPLIRFRTGDYSSYAIYNKSGRRVLNGIQGRWEEMKIYITENSFVTPTALNLHSELYCSIDGLQYFQEQIGELEVKIIPNKDYSSAVEEKLLKHYTERVPNTKIKISKVERLKKRENGKFLILESKVSLL